MTGVDPDIWYSVLIYNVTDNYPTAILCTDCINITETHYTFTPDYLDKYNIPVNGAGQVESSEYVIVCVLNCKHPCYYLCNRFCFPISAALIGFDIDAISEDLHRATFNKWNNHFLEMKEDVGMSVHEKGGKQVYAYIATPTHKTIYNPIPTSL